MLRVKYPESILNETQADDSALVNALTHYPEKAVQSIQDFSGLIQAMINAGELGEVVTSNATRRDRLNQLLAAILNNSTLSVRMKSFGTFQTP